MRRIARACLTFALISLSATAAFAGEPTEFVKKRTAEVTAVLSKPESNKRAAELNAIVQKSIDFRELAARSLKGYWENQPPEAQQEFLTLLQQMLQANYANKLAGRQLGKDYTVEYGAEKTRGELAVLRVNIIASGESKPVQYKLLQRDKSWIVYDIVIDDISLEETYRESYTEIIKDEGWGSLIQRMKDRVKELEAEAKTTKKSSAKR